METRFLGTKWLERTTAYAGAGTTRRSSLTRTAPSPSSPSARRRRASSPAATCSEPPRHQHESFPDCYYDGSTAAPVCKPNYHFVEVGYIPPDPLMLITGLSVSTRNNWDDPDDPPGMFVRRRRRYLAQQVAARGLVQPRRDGRLHRRDDTAHRPEPTTTGSARGSRAQARGRAPDSRVRVRDEGPLLGPHPERATTRPLLRGRRPSRGPTARRSSTARGSSTRTCRGTAASSAAQVYESPGGALPDERASFHVHHEHGQHAALPRLAAHAQLVVGRQYMFELHLATGSRTSRRRACTSARRCCRASGSRSRPTRRRLPRDHLDPGIRPIGSLPQSSASAASTATPTRRRASTARTTRRLAGGAA